MADKDVGEYIYPVDVGGGCYAEVLVTVTACPITIPDVFTPNGDGANNKFNTDGVCFYILYLKNRRKGEMEFKEYSGSVTVLRGK